MASNCVICSGALVKLNPRETERLRAVRETASNWMEADGSLRELSGRRGEVLIMLSPRLIHYPVLVREDCLVGQRQNDVVRLVALFRYLYVTKW
ncbi:hypothetical protein CDAR_531691 [Caerostris darwini]|uniref:Uncharacterized protein n=1 Tax=Caerostris darwini TaxID=1538125 RepID=A0AAV4QFD0_9ARAC|nr:hypothetical protein CDAR_531691 [Caerostris darwini]